MTDFSQGYTIHTHTHKTVFTEKGRLWHKRSNNCTNVFKVKTLSRFCSSKHVTFCLPPVYQGAHGLLSPPGDVSSWREYCNVEEHTTQLATTQSHESDNSLVFMIDSDSCTGPWLLGREQWRKVQRGVQSALGRWQQWVQLEGLSLPGGSVQGSSPLPYPVTHLGSVFKNSMSHIIIKNILDAKLGLRYIHSVSDLHVSE